LFGLRLLALNVAVLRAAGVRLEDLMAEVLLQQ
jgi:hypothetical protein